MPPLRARRSLRQPLPGMRKTPNPTLAARQEMARTGTLIPAAAHPSLSPSNGNVVPRVGSPQAPEPPTTRHARASLRVGPATTDQAGNGAPRPLK